MKKYLVKRSKPTLLRTFQETLRTSKDQALNLTYKTVTNTAHEKKYFTPHYLILFSHKET